MRLSSYSCSVSKKRAPGANCTWPSAELEDACWAGSGGGAAFGCRAVGLWLAGAGGALCLTAAGGALYGGALCGMTAAVAGGADCGAGGGIRPTETARGAQSAG